MICPSRDPMKAWFRYVVHRYSKLTFVRNTFGGRKGGKEGERGRGRQGDMETWRQGERERGREGERERELLSFQLQTDITAFTGHTRSHDFIPLYLYISMQEFHSGESDSSLPNNLC